MLDPNVNPKKNTNKITKTEATFLRSSNYRIPKRIRFANSVTCPPKSINLRPKRLEINELVKHANICTTIMIMFKVRALDLNIFDE